MQNMRNIQNMQNTKPNLPNQTYKNKSNIAYQAYWINLTKPKLLVKAANAWVRSAFGNVYSYNMVKKAYNMVYIDIILLILFYWSSWSYVKQSWSKLPVQPQLE